MSKIKVQSMKTTGGASSIGQFIIREWFKDGRIKAIYFQSYDSIIVKKHNGNTYLDKNYWDYSVTTSKYRNNFLCENISHTRAKIKSGEYKLTDLNK